MTKTVYFEIPIEYISASLPPIPDRRHFGGSTCHSFFNLSFAAFLFSNKIWVELAWSFWWCPVGGEEKWTVSENGRPGSGRSRQKVDGDGMKSKVLRQKLDGLRD